MVPVRHILIGAWEDAEFAYVGVGAETTAPDHGNTTSNISDLQSNALTSIHSHVHWTWI